MKALFIISLLSLYGFTHPFARDGSVDVNDSELWRERIERARENEQTKENVEDEIQREEFREEREMKISDPDLSDREKAELLVD